MERQSPAECSGARRRVAPRGLDKCCWTDEMKKSIIATRNIYLTQFIATLSGHHHIKGSRT